MMNHFSAIGLTVSGKHELQGLCERLFELAVEDEPTGRGERHVRWRDESGASLAFHMEHDAIACLTPFFEPGEGLSRWRVKTTGPTIDPCVHCSGADCDVVDEAGETITRATMQWLNFTPYRKWLMEPRTFELEVVGFAHSAAFVDGKEQFEALQARIFGTEGRDGRKPLRLAESSFVPEGMFRPPDASVSERAVALALGKVQRASVLTNASTGGRFHHVRIATLPGALDVVTDEPEGTPAVGQFALVRCWLVGRPAEPPPSKQRRGWWPFGR